MLNIAKKTKILNLNYQNQKQAYINRSKSSEYNRKRFLNKHSVLNEATGELYNLTYNLQEDYKKQYIDLTQNSIFIQNYALANNLDKCLFITITANTQYHNYKKVNNNYIKNPLYKEENTINKTYKLLNKTHRNIYKQVKRTIGKGSIQFIRVVEMHKNFTPHLHILMFFNSKNQKKIEKIIKNKVNCTSSMRTKRKDKDNIISKLQLNYNYANNIENDIGRVEVEEINNVERGAAYLAKYFRKQFNNSSSSSISSPASDLYLLDGWKKENKIKLVTTSYNPIPKYVYRKCNNHIGEAIKKKTNMLDYLVKNIDIKYYINNVDKSVKVVNKLNNRNAIYKVIVTKNRVKKLESSMSFSKHLKTIKKKYREKFIKEFMKDLYDYKNFFSSIIDIDINTYINNCKHYSNSYLIFKLEEFKDKYNLHKYINKVSNIQIYKYDKLVYNKKDYSLIESNFKEI